MSIVKSAKNLWNTKIDSKSVSYHNSTGGFHGELIKFDGPQEERYIIFKLPPQNGYIFFNLVRGNDVNGGEDPDNIDENLNIQFSLDNINWSKNYTLFVFNDTPVGPRNISIEIPDNYKNVS